MENKALAEAYLKLMAQVSKEGYITQAQYLELFAGSADEPTLLLSLYEMEQQGIFVCNRTGTVPVYYTADIKFQ